MLLKGFFCLLVIGFTSARLNMRGCGISKDRRPRIIDGKPVDSTSYPWMVFLGIDKGGRVDRTCGGTIINENWILTAAQCVNRSQIKSTVAYVGLRFQSKANDKYVQKLKLSRFIIHPHYNVRKNGAEYDIALLKTKHPMDIKGSAGHVNSICLPQNILAYPTGKAIAIGWGLTGWNCLSESPDDLQEVDVDIVPPDECLKLKGDRGPRTYVCAGGDGKNIGLGDGGDPLFQIDKKGVAYLIGITSPTERCDVKVPSVFTRVSVFLNWMEKEMKQLRCQKTP